MESVFHQEPNPDVEWMKKIAKFVEAPVEEVTTWFKAKRVQRQREFQRQIQGLWSNCWKGSIFFDTYLSIIGCDTQYSDDKISNNDNKKEF